MGSVATLVVALMMTSACSMMAQSPASAPMMPAVGPSAAEGPTAEDCMTQLFGMADCLSYVLPGSNATKPDAPCCPELKTLVDNSPACLCQMLANSSSTGFEIDVARATKLPTVCKVETPPLSACALLGYPVAGPTASEGPGGSEGPSGSEGISGSEGPTSGILPTAGSPTALPPAGNNGRRTLVSSSSLFMAAIFGFVITFY